MHGSRQFELGDVAGEVVRLGDFQRPEMDVVGGAKLALRLSIHRIAAHRGAARKDKSVRAARVLAVGLHADHSHRGRRAKIMRIDGLEDRLRELRKLGVELELHAGGKVREPLEQPLDERIGARFLGLGVEGQTARDLGKLPRELRRHVPQMVEFVVIESQEAAVHREESAGRAFSRRGFIAPVAFSSLQDDRAVFDVEGGLDEKLFGKRLRPQFPADFKGQDIGARPISRLGPRGPRAYRERCGGSNCLMARNGDFPASKTPGSRLLATRPERPCLPKLKTDFSTSGNSSHSPSSIGMGAAIHSTTPSRGSRLSAITERSDMMRWPRLSCS